MKRRYAGVWFMLLTVGISPRLDAFDYETLDSGVKESLLKGEVVALSKRPDETGEADKRFVTLAQVLEGTRRELWDVIHDKEDAELFVDGVLESKVIESSGTEILVEQKTRVGGPKGAYYYQLRHKLTPYSRSDFKFVSGEMRDVIGSWWIFDGPDEKRSLVVYSLHIDPGIFAPQVVVKGGMRKSMPGTLKSMQREVLRRRESGRNEKE
ncbi:MAG: SRPBCC family protein [Verrucomicrobiales bacterium]|nr:SRPBCC family protein [Verrucomicrobiales bacterium]